MPQQSYYNRLPQQSSPLAYELPDQRYLGQQPGQAPTEGGPYQPAVPLPGANGALAEVEGLTDAYYDTWGKLQGLTQSMHKDYGIDVTKPDLSQPGGGAPFKSYQKLQGMMMATANKLGNRLKEQQQAAPYKLTGQATGNGEEGDPYVSTNLAPELVQAQRRAEADFYTSGDAKRAYDANIAPIADELRKKAAGGDPYWVRQFQVAEKLRTTYQTHPSYFKAAEDEAKTKLKAAAGATREIGVLKRFTALKNGFWDEGSFSPVQIGEGTVLENKAHSGEYFGKATIKGKPVSLIVDAWQRKPDKSVWLTFKTDDESQITPDPIRVDNQNGADITAAFQQANSKFGQSPTMHQAIDILGYGDSENTGMLKEDALYDEALPNLEAKRSKMDDELQGHARVQVSKRSLGGLLDDLKSVSISGKSTDLPVTLPDGSNVVFKKHKLGSGYYAEGVGEHMTKEEVEKYLEGAGYFEKIRGGAAAKPTTSKTTSRDSIRAKIGQPGYEGYDEQELVDYYKSQGYTITE